MSKQPTASANSLSRTDAALRQGFKSLNRFMLLNWRLGLGPWLNAAPDILGRYLVITHTGRKSGKTYQTPVNYAEVDGEIYCTAGFGAVSDWYRNLMAQPTCEVWLPDGWWTATARDITGADNALPILREVLIGSAFAARVAGLDPQRMSDAELAEATQEYRLLHLRRETARTGPGGPGDLAWIWPLATFALLALLPALTGGRRRRTK